MLRVLDGVVAHPRLKWPEMATTLVEDLSNALGCL